MKKRITIHSSTLEVGETFYSTCYGDIAHCVMAQGPEILAYVEVGQPPDTSWIQTHEYVWIDAPLEAPRTKVGEFEVGEKFRRNGHVFIVTAVGRKNSFAEGPNGSEYRFFHENECEEVKG